MSPRLFRAARVLAAGLLLLTAARHVMLAFAREGSVTRHWVFVLVNVALAALLVWRPRWAFYPALALTGQQLWSHGQTLSESFVGTAPLDWASLAVCLFFPTLVTILFIERQDQDEVAAGGA